MLTLRAVALAAQGGFGLDWSHFWMFVGGLVAAGVFYGYLRLLLEDDKRGF